MHNVEPGLVGHVVSFHSVLILDGVASIPFVSTCLNEGGLLMLISTSPVFLDVLLYTFEVWNKIIKKKRRKKRWS
jgi:hypothetical protein